MNDEEHKRREKEQQRLFYEYLERDRRAVEYTKRYKRGRAIRWLLIAILLAVIAFALYSIVHADSMLVIPKLNESYSIIRSSQIVDKPGVVTEYDKGWLMRHDQASWQELRVGDAIEYNGTEYKVSNVYLFRALEPNSPYSYMQDTRGRVYDVHTTKQIVLCDGCITLQTCVDGNLYRLFIKARR